MAEPLTIQEHSGIYFVGGWSFDEDDKDLRYIDDAIAAWSAWREYVAREIEEQVLYHPDELAETPR